MNIKNDLLIRAMLRMPTERTPVWIMRQAGRYLPEYRKIRSKAGSFLALAKNPALATEVTLQPLLRYNLDGAILFSDILTIPDAMGMELYFVEGEGPRFAKPLNSEEAITSLVPPDPYDKLKYVIDTVEQVSRDLKKQVPLIGFSGSPFTLACYQIEGRGGTNFQNVKRMIYDSPLIFHKLLDVNARAIIDYLNAQINSGVDVVMLFDTWGGILTHSAYLEFSLFYLEKILSELKLENESRKVPSVIFTKGGGVWLEKIVRLNVDAVGIDWQVDLGWAKKIAGNKVALQGNLDPAVLLSSPKVVKAEVEKVLDSFGSGAGHVFNLGHGISQHTDPDNLQVLIETVKILSPGYR